MDYIKIGKVVNTHGIKGELKILSYSDFDEERYQMGNTVYILHAGNYDSLCVQTYRTHKGYGLVSFKERQDINLVEKYKGDLVFIAKKDRKPLPKGEYYVDEIIGLIAEDEEHRTLGTVIDLEETNGAQKNLRIRRQDTKDLLVPYLPAFVKKVELEKHSITVLVDEGLL